MRALTSRLMFLAGVKWSCLGIDKPAFTPGGAAAGARRNLKRFRGGLVLKAHRRLYHSTLGSRVIKKKKKHRASSVPVRADSMTHGDASSPRNSRIGLTSQPSQRFSRPVIALFHSNLSDAPRSLCRG